MPNPWMGRTVDSMQSLDAGLGGRFHFFTGETCARPGHQNGMHNLSKPQVVLSWVLQLAASGILLQTLIVCACSAIVLTIRRAHVPVFGRYCELA
jgi:hypothetical protein